MKIRNLFLPAIAVGTVIVFTTPKESHGFAHLGHDLSVLQADFRIFEDFADAAANNNTVPHANFPGALGAVMAIWKGCVEWSSERHGDGTGDPHQATTLGSGSSNFDPMFNGEALGVGSIGDNIISPLHADGGGTLAFMQGGSFGWWIRFYDDNWVWNDGPGTSLGGQEDLQGVACHEYGHSLGMDHTGVNGQTMWPFASGVSDRSIGTDDQAGIQALYGHKNDAPNTKPVITAAINLGGQIQITGINFTTNNNEVWFTRRTPATGGTGGNPIKVTGVSSTNSDTEILINIPPTAGPGDVIVKRNSSGQASTSNPWPFDTDSISPPVPTVTSIVPSIVPVLTPTGTANVTINGTGLSLLVSIVVDGVTVGSPGNYTGSFTIVDDTQVDFVMPLCPNAGTVNVDITTAGGLVPEQIEIVLPTTPALDVPSPTFVLADGIRFAVSSQDLDIQLLYFSIVPGTTSFPGVWTLDIGNGFVQNIFKVKTFNIGPKLWRQHFINPLDPGDAPPGLDVYFQCLVAHPGVLNNYAFPWDSSNRITRTVSL